MISPTLYSSKSDEWSTPDWLFDLLDKEFHFKLDAAASESNAKCPLYYTEENNGLNMPWRTWTWVNPPYTKGQITAWMAHAVSQMLEGVSSVFLVPARIDTRWWHDYVSRAPEVRLIKGRLKFGGMDQFAPFPSAIVIFSMGSHYCLQGQRVRYWDPRAKA